MVRIFLVLQIFLAVALFVTCERVDMHKVATVGPPPKTVIFLYYLTSTRTGNIGGRDGADGICRSEGILYNTFLNASSVKAFISVSPTDEIRFLVPVEYWYYPVYGISPALATTLISDSWQGLWDGGINASLVAATGIPIPPPFWWSGSNVDGSVAIGLTCGEWHNSDASPGQPGSQNGVAMNWIGPPTAPQACNTNQYVLCLAY
jgi:hypothetical protein